MTCTVLVRPHPPPQLSPPPPMKKKTKKHVGKHGTQRSVLLLISASHNDVPLPDLLVQLLLRDKPSEMQIMSAKVLAYLCGGGALDPRDPRIVMKVSTVL